MSNSQNKIVVVCETHPHRSWAGDNCYENLCLLASASSGKDDFAERESSIPLSFSVPRQHTLGGTFNGETYESPPPRKEDVIARFRAMLTRLRWVWHDTPTRCLTDEMVDDCISHLGDVIDRGGLFGARIVRAFQT